MEDFQQQGNEEEYRIDGGRRRRRDAIEWIANGYGKTTVKNLRFCVFNYLHFSLFSFFWGVLCFSEFWRGCRGVVVDYCIMATQNSEKVGTVAIAYAAHKAASPIRFPPTVALTPIVAGWMGKTGKKAEEEEEGEEEEK